MPSESEIAGGYNRRLLRLDLSTQQASSEPITEELLRSYVGGNGLAVRLAVDEIEPGTAAFDPGNKLIFATGPLNGTRVPGSGTFSVVGVGPLTGMGTATHANGFFGARLKFAGFDAIIVEGISPDWTYVSVDDGVVQFHDAHQLVGWDTFQLHDQMTKAYGAQASTVSIGPAGEHMVRFAGIFSDRGHSASTNGLGAVMGQKRLKAIVVRGTAVPKAADPERFNQLAREWAPSAKTAPLGGTVAAVGTVGMFSGAELQGWLAVKNLSTDEFAEHETFTAVREQNETRPQPCWACSFAHCQDLTLRNGVHAGETFREPEYEGMAAWGPKVGITDPNMAVYLNDLNDRLGMDLKEGGFTVAMAIEAYEKGILGPEQTDGLQLTWGNGSAVAELLRRIANRQGFGDVLAEGVYRASQRIGHGAEQLAVYTHRGNAPHSHDPRDMWGILFGQSVSDTGSIAGSVPDMMPDPTIGYQEALAPFSVEGVPTSLAVAAPRYQFQDSIGVCNFLEGCDNAIMAGAVAAMTGFPIDEREMFLIGRRTHNLLRLFNLAHGWSPEQDLTLSPRLREPVPDGPNKGRTIADVYPQMVHSYYEACGWDENGQPLPQTLAEVGLTDVGARLRKQQ